MTKEEQLEALRRDVATSVAQSPKDKAELEARLLQVEMYAPIFSEMQVPVLFYLIHLELKYGRQWTACDDVHLMAQWFLNVRDTVETVLETHATEAHAAQPGLLDALKAMLDRLQKGTQ